MAEKEIKKTKIETEIEDVDKKRKRDTVSSLSSALDTSRDTCILSPLEIKQKHKKKKKGKNEHELEEGIESQEMSKINKQLQDINKKLSNVITKDDGTLRSVIKETINEMKDQFLNSVMHRLDILEGNLFEKQQENEKLKSKVTLLQEKLHEQESEKDKLKREIENSEWRAIGKINDLEQYTRIKNIRIDGITESKNETSFQTEQKVVTELNKHIPKLMEPNDIEIAHRLGKQKSNGKPRQIIVQVVSRSTKAFIMKKKKLLKNTGIYLNEDLTRRNQYVLTCMRKKLPDEVDAAWSIDGRLFYKNINGSIHRVWYDDYQTWVDLPWPEPKKNTPVRGERTVTPPPTVG